MSQLIARLQPWRQHAATGWAWWIGELAAMLPAALRRPSRRSSTEIVLFDDRVEIIRITRDERAKFVDARGVEALDAEAWGELGDIVEGTRARILLPSPHSYVATITLPRQARPRLRSTVALQLETIAPLKPSQIVWTPRVVGSDRRSITVAVAMIRTERVAQLAALFGAHDLPLPTIAAVHGERGIDLVPGHDGSRTQDWRRNRQALAIAAALLATIPVSTALFAWIETQGNLSQVDFIRQQNGSRLDAERRLRVTETAKAALRPLVTRPTITGTLDDLATALPDTAFAKSASLLPTGAMKLEIEAPSAEAVDTGLASSASLARTRLRDQVPTGTDRMLLTYETPR